MFLTLRTRRCTAWIAMLALLLAALAPSFAQARAVGMWKAGGQLGGVWAEVCGPGGGKMVRLGDAPTQPADGALHLEHCPFCALDMPPAVLPAQVAAFAPSALPAPRPFLFYHASRPLYAWTRAQPRAPPALS
jgi:hypothetical protein